MIAPINPTPNQKIPEMKKERTIRMLPKMERTIDSCFPTFFILTIGFTSFPFICILLSIKIHLASLWRKTATRYQ